MAREHVHGGDPCGVLAAHSQNVHSLGVHQHELHHLQLGEVLAPAGGLGERGHEVVVVPGPGGRGGPGGRTHAAERTVNVQAKRGRD